MGVDDDDLATFTNDMNIVSGVLSSLSTVASFSVLLTGFMFPSLRREIFFQLILCTSFCDFCYSLVLTWGGDNVSIEMCVTQGIFVNLFTTASMLFVLMLCVTMFNLLQFQKQYMTLLHMNVIVWILSALCVVLPLTDPYITYYDQTAYKARDVCGFYIKTSEFDDDQSYLKQADVLNDWYLGMVNYPTLAIVAIMLALVIILYTYTLPQVRQNNEPARADRMAKLVNYIMLYPLALIIFQGPYTVLNIIVAEVYHQVVSPELLKTLYTFNAIYTLYGFVATMIFFANSSAARRLWRQWLRRHIGAYFGLEEENALLKGLSRQELSDTTLASYRRSESVLGNRKSVGPAAEEPMETDLVDLAINATFDDEEVQEVARMSTSGGAEDPVPRNSDTGSIIIGISSNLSPWKNSSGASGVVIEESSNPVMGGLEDTLRQWDVVQQGQGDGGGASAMEQGEEMHTL